MHLLSETLVCTGAHSKMVSTMTWKEVETKTGTNGDDALGALVGRSGHSITISENMMFMLGGETKPRWVEFLNT